MNNIKLEFEKSLSGLAGYDFGVEIYNSQVGNKIDFNNNTEIVFPNNIKRIASSFIQGFFAEIVKNIGITGIEEKIEFISQKENMKKTILDNLK